MASLAPSFSCTISRLNLFAELSHNHHKIRIFRTLSSKLIPQNSMYPRRSFKSSFSSTNFNSTTSSCSKILGSNVAFNDNLVVLGIETSCDDTAAAVVRGDGEILSQVVSSQADLLARYGGVAPKMAEEAHSQVIDQVVQDALGQANLTEKDLSAVAVTIGPGLSLCLRVGVQKARKIAATYQLPYVGVHHMEAHALVARLCDRDLQFPFMALLISGGHNIIVVARDLGHYLQLGTTIDDAIGEAYDKSAKWLGLDLRRSGGPALEELAKRGDPNSIKFSVPMKQHKDCNFSYAGLKTQVKLAIQSKNIDAGIPLSSASIEDQNKVDLLHVEENYEQAIHWALDIEPLITHLIIFST